MAVDSLSEMLGGGLVGRLAPGRLVGEHHLHGVALAAHHRCGIEAGVYQFAGRLFAQNEDCGIEAAVDEAVLVAQLAHGTGKHPESASDLVLLGAPPGFRTQNLRIKSRFRAVSDRPQQSRTGSLAGALVADRV